MIATKMRPIRFSDMVGQRAVVNNIKAQAIRHTMFPVYILGGQYGSGKTTMARIIALAANCKNPDSEGNPCGACSHCKAILSGCSDFLEIDGASNTGVDNVRQLQEYMEYLPSKLTKKVVIIDEVHMLSKQAFNSLLKLLEEPPAYAIFILATTDVESIPATVRSRAACYTFGQISAEDITNHLLKVAKMEKIEISKEAAMLIARRSNGAMRNALKLLEQCSYANVPITEELCNEVLGFSDDSLLFSLIGSILKRNIDELVKTSKEYDLLGKNFYVLTGELLTTLADIIACKCGVMPLQGTYNSSCMETGKKTSLSTLSKLIFLLGEAKPILRSDPTYGNFLANLLGIAEKIGIPQEIAIPLVSEAEETEGTAEPIKEEIPTEEPKEGTPSENDVDPLFADFFSFDTPAKEDPVKAEEKEEPKVDKLPIPEYLLREEGLSEKVNNARLALINLCQAENSINSLLNLGFTAEYTDNEIKLYTDEDVSQRHLILFLARYGISDVKVLCNTVI